MQFGAERGELVSIETEGIESAQVCNGAQGIERASDGSDDYADERGGL